MKCIVTTGSRDPKLVTATALLKRFENVDDIIVATPDDYDIISFVERNYKVIYNIGLKINTNCTWFSDLIHVINYIKQLHPNYIGFTYLVNDVTKNYFASTLFKTMDFHGAVSMVYSIIDRYIIDRNKISEITQVKDSNLFDLCFKHGAKICYIIDEKNQFVIATDRTGNISFDEDLFRQIANIVPDRKYLKVSDKVIMYGTNTRPLPRHVREMCEYTSEEIREILRRWYISHCG